MPFHAKASWGGSKGLSQALPETGTYFTFSQGAFGRCDILSFPWKTSENVREITLHLILLIPVICWFDIVRRVSTGDLWPRGAQPASQHNAGGAARSGASAGLGCGCRKLERCVEQVGPWELQSEWEEGADRRLFGRLFFFWLGFLLLFALPQANWATQSKTQALECVWRVKKEQIKNRLLPQVGEVLAPWRIWEKKCKQKAQLCKALELKQACSSSLTPQVSEN